MRLSFKNPRTWSKKAITASAVTIALLGGATGAFAAVAAGAGLTGTTVNVGNILQNVTALNDKLLEKKSALTTAETAKTKAESDLRTANSTIASLQAQISTLNGQVTTAQQSKTASTQALSDSVDKANLIAEYAVNQEKTIKDLDAYVASVVNDQHIPTADVAKAKTEASTDSKTATVRQDIQDAGTTSSGKLKEAIDAQNDLNP